MRISNSLKSYYETEVGVEAKCRAKTRKLGSVVSDETKIKLSKPWPLDRKRISNKMTDETRMKLSQIAKDRRFGGHTSKRRIWYQKLDGSEVYLQSSYEVRFAKLLDEMCVVWERPPPLQWVDNQGSFHLYYPDFKVGEVYFDTKNDYLVIKDALKIEAVRCQNEVRIEIITEKELTIESIKARLT